MNSNSSPSPSSQNSPESARRFATTSWSMIVDAGGENSSQSQLALQELCQRYWYPLYFFVRRKGYSHDDAEDLTQGFFAHLLDRDRLLMADQSKGRFRSFLLRSIENFATQKWREKTALKRGGQATHLSLDFEDANRRYATEPADELTPDKAFARKWALKVLEGVLEDLRQYYEAKDKSELFEALKHRITAPDPASYKQVAEDLGMSEIAVKVAAHRMRTRYRDMIRQTIEQTVASPEEVELELAELFQALS